MSAFQQKVGGKAAVRPGAPGPARRAPTGALPLSGPLQAAGPAFPLQRRSTGESGPGGPPPDIGQRIRARAGGGAPLDDAVRTHLETALGADLSRLRVHTDAEADQLSRSVQAVAFTSGSDIYFRSGTYNPAAADGLRLLAHEATHTVQQAAGPVAGTPAPGGISLSDPSDSFERAAEATAARVVATPPAQRRAAAHEEEP